MGIRKLYTDTEGMKIIFVDEHCQGYVFLPVINRCSHIATIKNVCVICV